jgi:RNA polymerase sigma-70 factor (ECF subfamily)
MAKLRSPDPTVGLVGLACGSKLFVARSESELAVDQNNTTAVIQRYLDELAAHQGESPAEPVVSALLERSVRRLRLLCAALLHKSYPRLAQPPLGLEADEVLNAVVERLLKAMREVRPLTVRQFFALANQHMRWELNDLARRLDQRVVSLVSYDPSLQAPESSGSAISPNATRMLEAIETLPEEEREVFDLVRIQAMTQGEAAALIGVSAKTVQRRLNRGLLLLAEMLGDLRPSQLSSDER